MLCPMLAINSDPTFRGPGAASASFRCLCVIVKLHGSLTVVFEPRSTLSASQPSVPSFGYPRVHASIINKANERISRMQPFATTFCAFRPTG